MKTKSIEVAMTANQYAGNRRAIRDETNCGIVRPHEDIRITNPDITKNNCTPKAPYAATGEKIGKNSTLVPPHFKCSYPRK